MLVLFDIDGTLLLTQKAGVNAMMDAGREVVGPDFSFDGIEFAGRLDPAIWASAAAANGVDDPSQVHAEFREVYAANLARRFEIDPTAFTLPGVETLVGRVADLDGAVPGLLTGNYPETGRLKIQAAGLDPDLFTIAAWGSDGDTRRDLPPVAIQRYGEHFGESIDPKRVVIIGDTPHDIDCAHANGCLVIAVATGPSNLIDELGEHKPDLLLEDLSDTDRIIGWLSANAAAAAQ